MSAYAWIAKLGISPEDGCRCGHNAHVHLHGKSCTAVIDESRMRYCKCESFRAVAKIQDGEDEMAKKTKRVKKQVVPRGERLYEAFSSKVEAHAIAKKVADRDCKQHAPIVVRVLLSFDKPVSVERIVTAAKNSGYDAKNAERYIKGDLGFLVREGLAKATSIEAPKPKKAQRKRASKPKAVFEPSTEVVAAGA